MRRFPAADSAEAAVAAVDPATVAGSQSLLLEASDNGTTGAVPFSGTVDWSQGHRRDGPADADRQGQHPGAQPRGRRADPQEFGPQPAGQPPDGDQLPGHDSFIGGSIAGLPGVLLKNEELVQGTPLVGASARVVGNSFLFALSASPEDVTANTNLLTSRKWMDLALIYATGKRAIITLEKDATAQRCSTRWSRPGRRSGQ